MVPTCLIGEWAVVMLCVSLACSMSMSPLSDDAMCPLAGSLEAEGAQRCDTA